MKNTYSFLNDELAVIEIRKHQWLESEKDGHELGFATAAIDWVEKHGLNWKKHRFAALNTNNVLTEKRQHRRFNISLPVLISLENNSFATYTTSVNLVGFSCVIPTYIATNTPVNITINLRSDRRSFRMSKFKFKSKIIRITNPREDSSNLCYQAVISFSEELRDFIRTNSELITNL